MSASSAAAAISRYGKLWGRGHETFSPSLRRILSVKGKGNAATKYLQGLVTCDLTKPPVPPRMLPLPPSSPQESNATSDEEKKQQVDEMKGDMEEKPVPVHFSAKMRSACFLDQKGRILTDALLWKRPFDESNHDIIDDTNEEGEVEYLIDVPGDSAEDLLEHLKKYKLRRSKVTIGDVSDDFSVHCIYGTLNAQGAPPGYIAVSCFGNSS